MVSLVKYYTKIATRINISLRRYIFIELMIKSKQKVVFMSEKQF